jgi:hypothetical protein
MRRDKLGKRRLWFWAAAMSILLHIGVVAALYLSADQLLSPQSSSTADRGPVPELFLDVEVVPPEPERIIAASTPYNPVLSKSLVPVIEPVAHAPTTSHPSTDVGPGPPTAAVGDPKQPAAWFPEAPTARSVVFLIDRSGSMGRDSRFQRACTELSRALAALPADTRFQVIVYNRFAERLPGSSDLVPATAENKRRATEWLASLGPEGSTDYLPALRQAIVLGADLIYLLTDGDDFPAADVQLVTKLNRGRSVIHTLMMAPARTGMEHSPLAELARANHGSRRCVGEPGH